MAYSDPVTKLDLITIAGALLSIHQALGSLREGANLPPQAQEANRAETKRAMDDLLEKCQVLVGRLEPQPTNALMRGFLAKE